MFTLRLRILKSILVLPVLLGYGIVLASPTVTSDVLVLGVIVSDKNEGVALLKNMDTKQTFAAKEGALIKEGWILKSVKRKYIEVMVNNRMFSIDVGGESLNEISRSKTPMAFDSTPNELELEGGVLKISEAMKDQLVNFELDKILMQAAAVPHIVEGELKGFQLWEIEKDSVFEKAGFKDGDLITKINEHDIDDVGKTVRLLSSLKSTPEATFNFVRDGQEKNLTVIVQ